MKTGIKKNVVKLILWLSLGFVVLFVFRFIYGFTITINEPEMNGQIFSDLSVYSRNIASKKYEKRTSSIAPSVIKADQKYEKVAKIASMTSGFDQDEKSARSSIQSFEALIQFEQKSGNDGNRKLNLIIGVPPNNFDSLYVQMIKIGRVQAKQITKKDKTNEYKELNAKKNSLEKIRSSLLELKSKGGKIEEYMQLENRILEIEQQLQDLGVSLGDFDDENEFCTIQFSLRENRDVKISTIHRIKVALEWTIKFYLRLMATLFFISLFAYLLVVGYYKIKNYLITSK